MSQPADFTIRDGILLKYRGTSGTVTVPKEVAGIPSNVFRESGVEEVILPEGLVWMGSHALSKCPHLRRLVLPGTLRVVPDSLCYGSRALTEVVIPEGIVFLSSMAFCATGLRNVTIPDSVRVVGDNCFMSCKNLEIATLEEGLRELGAGAFDNCCNLRSISFPDSLRCIQGYAFKDCLRLKSLRLGREVETIDSCAFMGCHQLQDVEFPAALESVGKEAFIDCPSLERITFQGNRVKFGIPGTPLARWRDDPPLAPVIRAPQMLPEWFPPVSRPAALKGFEEMKAEGWPLDPNIAEAWEAFGAGADPDAPEEWAGPFRVVDGILCGVARPEGRVEVPEGVTGIRAEAFQGTAVQEVWLPDSVKWIQAQTFQDCGQLREIRLPAGLTRIPDRLFLWCRSLRSIHIPDRVAHIDPYSFWGSGLETLTLPPSLEIIDIFAFTDCVRLRRVRFPEGLREILCGAFLRCSSLTEISLPHTLVHLELFSFSNCTALEKASIGEGLDWLPADLVTDCPNLKDITCHADHLSIGGKNIKGRSQSIRFRLEGSFLELGPDFLPLRIVAPNADPTTLNKRHLRALLQGFASEDGKGFRYEAKYLKLLRSHKREFWDSGEILRFLLRHDMLKREEIPDCLDALQEKNLPGLVVEVLEYCRRRFPDPAAPLLLE